MFISVYVCVCPHMFVCTTHRCVSAYRDQRVPGAGLTGSCGLLYVCAGKELWFSSRAVQTLKRGGAISPTLTIFFLI